MAYSEKEKVDTSPHGLLAEKGISPEVKKSSTQENDKKTQSVSATGKMLPTQSK